MDQVIRFLKKLNYEFGSVVSHMDSSTWVVLAFTAFLIGMFLMRGNPLRAS